MAMSSVDIQTCLQQSFPDAKIQIIDTRGDGDHYAVTIASAIFQGKTRIQQHQLVYEALGGRMGNQLHALSITTKVLSSI